MSAQLQSRVVSIDAPIEGWDAFNSLDNMPENAAVILDNLIPSAGRVVSRLGSEQYVDLGTAAAVETVAGIETGSINKLFAASGGGIYDITDSASVSVTTQPSAITSDRWQVTTFMNAGGQRQIWCNGQDNARTYDGTTWADLVDTDVVGIDFLGGVAYKGRMYYWKDGDSSFWYADAGAFQGNLSEFDLGPFAAKGGSIQFMITWTQTDSGDGRDDFLVIAMTTGEIIIYQGDSPDPGQLWEMVGRYVMSPPLGPRAWERFGTDTIILTKDGYVSLSTIVQQGRVSDVNQFSRLIYRAVTQRARALNTFFGWESTLWARGGLMFFNVPLTSGRYEQHVLNVITMRWCRFTGWDIATMEEYGQELYGGTPDGRVLKVMSGTNDEGLPIQCKALTAYQYLGNRGYSKHLNAAEILSTAKDPGKIRVGGWANFQIPGLPTIASTEQPQTQATWANTPPATGSSDGSDWAVDNDPAGAGDYWATVETPITTTGWQNVSAYGDAVALSVQFALVNEQISWRSTSIRFIVAGAQ